MILLHQNILSINSISILLHHITQLFLIFDDSQFVAQLFDAIC